MPTGGTSIFRSVSKKLQTTVPTLVEGPNMICDAKEKAELLNEFFSSQSRLDDSSSSVPVDFDHFPAISALLSSVDINKACGPDGVSNKIIKSSADGITKVFTDLVNLSLLSQWSFFS